MFHKTDMQRSTRCLVKESYTKRKAVCKSTACKSMCAVLWNRHYKLYRLHDHKTSCSGFVTHIAGSSVSPATRGQSLAADGISYNAAISACADGRHLGSTEGALQSRLGSFRVFASANGYSHGIPWGWSCGDGGSFSSKIWDMGPQLEGRFLEANYPCSPWLHQLQEDHPIRKGILHMAAAWHETYCSAGHGCQRVTSFRNWFQILKLLEDPGDSCDSLFLLGSLAPSQVLKKPVSFGPISWVVLATP